MFNIINFFSDILNDNENDPSGGGGGLQGFLENGQNGRPSRQRRPRSVVNSGREREFTGGSGPTIINGDPSGTDHNGNGAADEADALLRKLRAL